MSADDAFVEYLCELLEPLGECTARKMFGGYGIHSDALMIGLVDDGQLFLKVDELTKPKFRAAGCAPFVYEGMGTRVEMSYWSVPDDALESFERMAPWARLAQAAALRHAQAKALKVAADAGGVKAARGNGRADTSTARTAEPPEPKRAAATKTKSRPAPRSKSSAPRSRGGAKPR
jgi:DNA transformation protein